MTQHQHRKLMPDVRLWTGIAAIAVAVLTATEFSVQVFVWWEPGPASTTRSPSSTS
jgi:hypothetical protein